MREHKDRGKSTLRWLVSIGTHAARVISRKSIRSCVGRKKPAVENLIRTSPLVLRMGDDGAAVKKKEKKHIDFIVSL